MRIALLTFFFVVLLYSGLTGQTSVNLTPTPSAKYENRTFLGKAGVATLEVLGMETFTSTIMILLPTSITHWEDQYWLYFWRNFKRAYIMPPVWDQDPWVVDYIGHPYQGAVFFNSLRSKDCSFWASAVFNVFHTFLWEYGIEAVMERPSAQDLITTPVAGIALGELFHFLTKKMRRGGFTTGEKILVTLINPSYVLNNGYR
ncbi:MAG: DUF3943 domain-containing protein [Porphyromonadaceae bacterium]|nr:MAG: DUF3943 domain-containing protein [Porphyromonadaceae bacterium]